MCHVDSLKMLKNPLPLPPPQDKIWMATQHVIDDLYIHNHKRQSCHDTFNPEKVRKEVPEANLMCAEQTFAWQVLALDIYFLPTSSFSYSIVDFV